MRWVVVLALLVAGCAEDSGDPASPTPTGTVVVRGTIEEITQGTDCDDEAGRRIVWYDATQKVIATDTATRRIKQDFDGDEEVCRIADAYEVEVPRITFYLIEIGGIPNGRLGPISFKQLRDADFTLDLSISQE